jgi:hypothetical protein
MSGQTSQIQLTSVNQQESNNKQICDEAKLMIRSIQTEKFYIHKVLVLIT